ncbi:unnamed protein product, partial [Mesorhabditis belari]|uniref:Uncharacterized protein n=1 Tax=Mesorhabditis belari TaxID=2138241 RepID=A0AAF3EFK3_9BILA
MTSSSGGPNQNPGTPSAYFTPGGAAKPTGAGGAFSANGTGAQSAYIGVEAQPAAGNQSAYISAGAYNNSAATGEAPQAAPMPATGCTTPAPMDRSLGPMSTPEGQDLTPGAIQYQRHIDAILLAAKRGGVPAMGLFDSPAPMDRSLLDPLLTPEREDLALGLTPRQCRGRSLFDSPAPTKGGGASMTGVGGPAVVPGGSIMTADGHTGGGVGASGEASKMVEAPVPTTAPSGGAATSAYIAAPGQATGGGAQSAYFDTK